jgi:hypothetical protein
MASIFDETKSTELGKELQTQITLLNEQLYLDTITL